MKNFLLVLVGTSLMIQSVWSRPVSYPGGVTTIINNNANKHLALVHYSPTVKYSVGLRSEYLRHQEYSLNSIQLNNLIQRWNKKDSQANFYFKSGIGFADRNSSQFEDDSSLAAFIGISADWETRRLFAKYENRLIEAGSVDDRFVQQTRLGIAPYLADFNQLHMWLMVEVEHEPEGENKFTVTPLVRLFKDVHLLEAGISSHNDVLFNWTIRF